jgi:hypothetical protein
VSHAGVSLGELSRHIGRPLRPFGVAPSSRSRASGDEGGGYDNHRKFALRSGRTKLRSRPGGATAPRLYYSFLMKGRRTKRSKAKRSETQALAFEQRRKLAHECHRGMSRTSARTPRAERPRPDHPHLSSVAVPPKFHFFRAPEFRVSLSAPRPAPSLPSSTLR